jgi:hypothetical protein
MDYSVSYASALDAIAPGITDQVAAEQSQGESWVDALAKVLPVLATTYQQRQLLEVQLQRARSGLPPLDVSQYSPGVQVGLTSDTRLLLIIGGAALAAVLLLPMLMGRSKR